MCMMEVTVTVHASFPVCHSHQCTQLMDKQRDEERREGEHKTAAVQLRRAMDDVKHKNAKVPSTHCVLVGVGC